MDNRQIVNGDRPTWTVEQDDFLRRHADLPNFELGSAVTKKFGVYRSRESVRKRKQRLRKYAAQNFGAQVAPRISLSIGGLQLIAPVNAQSLRTLMGSVKFTDIQPTM